MDVLIANRVALLIIGTVFFIFISKKTLKNIWSHGFYRFFVFEGILSLVCLNLPFWFSDPFSSIQILSWSFLGISVGLVLHGLYQLKTLGGSKRENALEENFAFENTTELVVTGVYKYIRHPMYSSLFFLACGVFFKDISFYSSILFIITCVCLQATAKIEETENRDYFGIAYTDYMKYSRMFIPKIY